MSPVKKDDKKKKKHHAITPETIPSPTHSENDKVDILNDDEIQGFAIREEELEKLRNNLRCKHLQKEELLAQHKHQVTVQKRLPPQKQPVHHPVVIARPASETTKFREVDYTGPAGPKYNAHGIIVDYSLLGTVEDFVEEAINHQHLQIDTPTAAIFTEKCQDTIGIGSQYVRPKSVAQEKTKHAFDQSSSLQNWQYHMHERKKQEHFISKTLDKPIDDLVMNRDYMFRAKKETQNLMDFLRPTNESERAYREGVEFWKQPEMIGTEETGLHLTLTKAEQGFPYYYEHIRKPLSMKVETGIPLNQAVEDSKWYKGDYLRRKINQLIPEIKKYGPKAKNAEGLEIVNNANKVEKTKHDDLNQGSIKQDTTSRKANVSLPHGGENSNGDPLSMYPDYVPKINDGPSIVFNGHPAAWTGSSDENKGQVGLTARMNFTACITSRDVVELLVENNGTTSIRFEWSKVPAPSMFDNIHRDSIQRFYFNVGNGVILPGDVAVLPFTFKSPNAGIFHEKWKFTTQPTVLGGASLILMLKGVATRESHQAKMRAKCDAIERSLHRREAEVVVGRMMNELIRGIRTPQRSPSPIDSHQTEEELFVERNPGLFYNHQVVQELKQIYQQLYGDKPDELGISREWNLSIDDLRECIRSIDDVDAKEELLHGVNNVISSGLSEPIVIPPTAVNYNATLAAIQLFLDEMASCSMYLRSAMCMPDIKMTESLQSVNEKMAAMASREVSPTIEETSSKEKSGKKKNAKDDKQSKKKDGKKEQRPKSKEKDSGGRNSRNSMKIEKDTSVSFEEEASNELSIAAAKEVDHATIVAGRESAPASPAVVDAATYDKYKEKFRVMTRELLLDTLDRIFGFFEEEKEQKENIINCDC